MKKPVLYFVIGMLMHTPFISQTVETDKEDRIMAFSKDCLTRSLCLFEVKIQSNNLNPLPGAQHFYK